jgi:hypothetical protein
VRAKRDAWAQKVPGLDPSRLVFLDETGANTKMTRRYGRAARGTRVVRRVPYGHWKTTTFVAGLRADGLVAPMVLDGAMNGDVFVAYAEQVLVPVLRPIALNLRSLKREDWLTACGNRLENKRFLPRLNRRKSLFFA